MWVIQDNFCSVYGSCNGQTYVWVAIKFFWKGTFISKAQRMLDNCYRLKFNLKRVCCCVGERGKVRAELGWDQNLCFMNLLLPGLYCRKFIRRHFPDISVLDNVWAAKRTLQSLLCSVFKASASLDPSLWEEVGTLGFRKTDGWARRQSQPVEHIVCNFYVSQPVEKMSWQYKRKRTTQALTSHNVLCSADALEIRRASLWSFEDLVLIRTKLLKWFSFSPHFTQKVSFSKLCGKSSN